MALVALAAVDELDFGVAGWRARGRMDVVATKVGAVLESFGDGEVGKVLVPEGNDLALRNVEGELVLGAVAERGQLDALDLGADGGRQVGHRGAGRQEVREGRVGVFAVLVVFKGLERGVSLLGIPSGQIVRVLRRRVSSRLLVARSCQETVTLAPLPPFLPVSTSRSMDTPSVSLYWPRLSL